MTGADDGWSSFTRDPRLSEHATLRASDADREVVHQVLAEAYADGRLDREEFDVRSTDIGGARTLGDIPGLLEDLVPTSAVPALVAGGGLMTPREIEERALVEWRSDRRSAFLGFLVASLICWTIWATTMYGGFPWPVFVMLGTGINALHTQFQREELVAKERRRLEKKQRKQLEQRSPKDDERRPPCSS